MAKRIVVSLMRQSLQAYDGDKLVYDFNCVSGASDTLTPTGRFRIFRKDLHHRSRQFNNAPMDHALFFHQGAAIHQAYAVTVESYVKALLPFTGGLGSHGCVRLSEFDARQLYDWAPVGTPVEIH